MLQSSLNQNISNLKEGLNLNLLFEHKQSMQDAVNVTIRRYEADDDSEEMHRLDAGEIVYNYNSGKNGREKYLDLKFCIYGNCYCEKDCNGCVLKPEIATVDYFNFRFDSIFLRKLVTSKTFKTRREKVLAFKYPKSFNKSIPMEDRNKSVLNALLDVDHNQSLDNILLHSKVSELLLYSMEVLNEEVMEMPSCPFLLEAEVVNRIYDARDILEDNLGTPLTIKELSKKIAMNECYLKKGFKELFGTTIFEFYQDKRMEKARYLLYEKGLNVTEVSELLGYSSISHFSTAFKKFTGLKPCELLMKQNF
ncbi:helix-turn-helix domain-containing protein [Rhizosphaericola mali]|uniref:Helix-turn-helix transcriptional regulator n=1 Tax=Rhizosphaericola mali TaxID=2545455 RepID=A0A5P2G696_9BACT|nr:AraC family transcriptional regulator [Rhizosphaericola mali]QES89769.1 helix-turn-helix transcriptional regulator [Rhizosphaericola mali]